jgi:hypothetical protein
MKKLTEIAVSSAKVKLHRSSVCLILNNLVL